jgi:nicotinamidase-related amidase
VSGTALIVVDMLNPYQHRDAELLTASVDKMVEPLADLISRAHRADGVELIYVNDNYGDFTADFAEIVRSARNGARPDLVEPVVPQSDCLILTKVRHSAFYATALGYLLGRLETTRIVLTGQVTEQCILYSALDGYVRHFDVVVPTDAVAHIDPELGDAALKMMSRNMRAELRPAADCLR